MSKALKGTSLNQIFAEKLFLHVLKDLSERREIQYVYHRLNCGRLLRQLLVDGDILANIANRRVHISLRFVVIEDGSPPIGLESIPEGMKHYLIPSPGPGAYFSPLKIDQYLSRQIANYGDEWITVKDLIKYVANSYGGVHLDPLQPDLNKLHKLDHMASANGEGAIFALLSPIINTVLAALLPLRDSLLEKFRVDGEKMEMDDTHRVVDIVHPGDPDKNKGTVSFWLKSNTQPTWYSSAADCQFSPMKSGSFQFLVSKVNGRLYVKTSGIFGEVHDFVAPLPDEETVAPEHGIHIFLSWDHPNIKFYVQGSEIA
jgi:hypothetical protein